MATAGTLLRPIWRWGTALKQAPPPKYCLDRGLAIMAAAVGLGHHEFKTSRRKGAGEVQLQTQWIIYEYVSDLILNSHLMHRIQAGQLSMLACKPHYNMHVGGVG